MLELRIVKTLETVLARFTRCELFLARFYDARSRESLHSKMKKRNAVSVCKECLMIVMEQAHISAKDRKVAVAAVAKAEETNGPAVAIELNDGTIITGKTSSLLGASSAMLLDSLKHLAGIPDEVRLLSPMVIEPIQNLKTKQLGHNNPRLHMDEVLVALSVCALTDYNAKTTPFTRTFFLRMTAKNTERDSSGNALRRKRSRRMLAKLRSIVRVIIFSY